MYIEKKGNEEATEESKDNQNSSGNQEIQNEDNVENGENGGEGEEESEEDRIMKEKVKEFMEKPLDSENVISILNFFENKSS